jgi:hypothetical protein
LSRAEERGRWLVVGCIVVLPALDTLLFVLGWRLLPKKPEPLTHLIRILMVVLVGVFLYRGHVWARWFLIVTCGAVVALGVMNGSALIGWAQERNPFGLVALAAVGASAVTLLFLLASPSVRGFLASQRARRRPRPA